MTQCRMGWKPMRTANARLIMLDRRARGAEKRIRRISGRKVEGAKASIERELRALGERGRGKLGVPGDFEREANKAVERHISAAVRGCREESERLGGMLRTDAGREMAAWAAGAIGSLFSLTFLFSWTGMLERLPKAIQELPHAAWAAAAAGLLVSIGIFAFLRRQAKKSCEAIIARAEKASSLLKARIAETETIIDIERGEATRKLKNGESGKGGGKAGE